MADCVQNCPVAEKVNRLEEQLDEFQAQNGESHREIYGRLNSLEKSSAVTAVQFNSIMDKLDILTKKVGDLEGKPGQRWELVVTSAITAVVVGLATFLLAKGGIV